MESQAVAEAGSAELGRRAAASAAPSWPPLPCRGACAGVIQSADPARFCDIPGCDDWAVCRTCAPVSADHLPLLCPAHQLHRRPLARGASGTGREAVRQSETGTIGRLLARVWARTEGATSEELLDFPPCARERPTQAAEVPVLARAAGVALDDLWPPARKARVMGPAARLHRFALHIGAGSEPMAELGTVLMLYVRRRIDDPLQGWAPVKARTAANDVSAVVEGIRSDAEVALPSYGGQAVKKYLALRGAFERAHHTRNWPVSTRALWLLRDRVPASSRLTLHAALFQSLFALRPGIVPQVKWRMLTRSDDGWSLAWDRRTKARRGDRLGAADQELAPQFSAAAGVVLDAVLDTARAANPGASPGDCLFPTVTAADITLLLRAYLPAPPAGFVLRAHGIRAGTATVLAAMGVPADVVRAWGWWSRAAGMDGYYASVNTAVMRAAARRLHDIELDPESPGFATATLHGPPLPKWGAIPLAHARRPQAAIVAPVGGDESSSEDSEGEPLPRTAAPADAHRRRAARAKAS